MDLEYSIEERRLRAEIRSFFTTACDPASRRKLSNGHRLTRGEVVAWQRVLYERGWAAPHWPIRWGGTDWSPVQHYIFNEETHLCCVPEPLAQNTKMVGPVVIAFGTEEQKRRFLPAIARLDMWFCQGFSEPGAGSDLASIRTVARREGDHYVVTGQKIWTTGAQNADWMFCLVRTDTEAKAQRGITFLLVDMSSPGVVVRPIPSIDGARELNEVFLDGVRVPVSNRVGDENRGWDYAKYLLANERTNIARVGLSKQRLFRARRIEAEAAVLKGATTRDPEFARRMAATEAELKALEITQLRVLASRREASTDFDPMSSVLKVRGSELQQMTAELVFEAAGEWAVYDDPAAVDAGGIPPGDMVPEWAPGVSATYFFSRAASIYGGSNEIQRNILAKTVLKL